jgi:hypothetical protein
MAKSKNVVKAIGDKLDKVNDGFSINRYDNGYMLDVGGKRNDEWANLKIIVGTVEELITLIREYDSMDVNE